MWKIKLGMSEKEKVEEQVRYVCGGTIRGSL